MTPHADGMDRPDRVDRPSTAGPVERAVEPPGGADRQAPSPASATTPLPDLVQFFARPGVIDLAWGHPAPELLPVEEIRRAAGAALDRYGPDALNYGTPTGPRPLLDWLCRHLARVDARAPSGEEILITGGVSQALDQVATLLAPPGSVVLVEAPTYHLAVKLLRDHPLELVAVPFDEAGVRVDALAHQLSRLRREGRPAHLLYTIPTHHNPTGVTLDADRRRSLVELAATEGLVIVEDDVYRELSYDGPPPPSLWSLAPPGVVVRLGSFAKSFAPGLRLGWLTANAATIRRFVDGGLLDSGGGINHFSALVVAVLAADGTYDRHVARLREAYRERRAALLDGLAAHLPPGCRWLSPGGGYFVWLHLPAGVSARALLPVAEAEGVSFVPGRTFYLPGEGTGLAGDEPDGALRLAFSRYRPAELVEAARRLGVALKRLAGG